MQILGKALFWDQQIGSDGQACASCHFAAGSDNRSINALNPGSRNTNAAEDTLEPDRFRRDGRDLTTS